MIEPILLILPKILSILSKNFVNLRVPSWMKKITRLQNALLRP